MRKLGWLLLLVLLTLPLAVVFYQRRGPSLTEGQAIQLDLHLPRQDILSRERNQDSRSLASEPNGGENQNREIQTPHSPTATRKKTQDQVQDLALSLSQRTSREWKIKYENGVPRTLSSFPKRVKDSASGSTLTDLEFLQLYSLELGIENQELNRDPGRSTQNSLEKVSHYEHHHNGLAVQDSFLRIFSSKSEGTLQYIINQVSPIQNFKGSDSLSDSQIQDLVYKAVADDQAKIREVSRVYLPTLPGEADLSYRCTVWTSKAPHVVQVFVRGSDGVVLKIRTATVVN